MRPKSKKNQGKPGTSTLGINKDGLVHEDDRTTLLKEETENTVEGATVTETPASEHAHNVSIHEQRYMGHPLISLETKA